MYMTDFQYGGLRLSDIGCIIASVQTNFDTSASMGSQLSFEKVINNNSFRNNIATSNYEDPLSATFDIVKDPCKYPSDFSFNDVEIRHIMTWLNRRQYYKFKPYYDHYMFYDLYYNGTFDSVKCIYNGENVIGFTLSFLADAPWEYGEPVVSKGQQKLVVHNDCDQVGSIYPSKFIITCKKSGTVSIYNASDKTNKKTTIKNCIQGEIITLDCENKIIASSVSHLKLYNDFNYVYPTLIKSYDSTENIFIDELGSTMELIYSPIRKVGVML